MHIIQVKLHLTFTSFSPELELAVTFDHLNSHYFISFTIMLARWLELDTRWLVLLNGMQYILKHKKAVLLL